MWRQGETRQVHGTFNSRDKEILIVQLDVKKKKKISWQTLLCVEVVILYACILQSEEIAEDWLSSCSAEFMYLVNFSFSVSILLQFINLN